MGYKIGNHINRLIFSYSEDTIVIRDTNPSGVIGKTMRVHIILDRGLGLEVPVYWSKKLEKTYLKNIFGKCAHVEPIFTI
jgi:hypothetical protein